jgi:hypothetical protein
MTTIASTINESDDNDPPPPSHGSPATSPPESTQAAIIPAPPLASRRQRKNIRKRKRTDDGDEEERLPRWSYRKPATPAKVQEEFYGKKLKLLKKTKKRFRPASRIQFSLPSDILANALREIRYYQKHSGILIPKGRMAACIRSALEETLPKVGFLGNPKEYRLSAEAIAAIHCAAEPFLTGWFEMLFMSPSSVD